MGRAIPAHLSSASSAPQSHKVLFVLALSPVHSQQQVTPLLRAEGGRLAGASSPRGHLVWLQQFSIPCCGFSLATGQPPALHRPRRSSLFLVSAVVTGCLVLRRVGEGGSA